MEYVKENVRREVRLAAWVPALALLATAGALLAAQRADSHLPASLPRTAPRHRFIGDLAYQHLLDITAIGPRVAGSYENEVRAVRVVTEALRAVAEGAAPHHRLDVDLHTASGAFSLSFFDGMNNIYQDVQSVVARLRSANGRPSRHALLINCHYDTVPDSPGASDDAAGCAVGLETLRALAASRAPLPRDVLLLLNGAEENIMQASHAFITTHKWAKNVRAFINVEACGAGGREVMFQAGPNDPWIVEVYAQTVPRPFASSLAQEMFESGLVPADTDFRIFRDFGNLSGVDLAWSADGFAYHTRLDAADRVPPAALQRTGDNVLALALGMVRSEQMGGAVQAGRPPVFFDVLGAGVVRVAPPAGVAAAAATLALLALRLRISANAARTQLLVSRGAWYGSVWAWWWRGACACAAGVACAGGGALAAGVAGARLAYYARPLLLVPLAVGPTLAAALLTLHLLPRERGVCARGWWAWRGAAEAGCAGWGALAAGGVALRLRAAFVPLLWVLLPAAADLLASLHAAAGAGRAWWGVVGVAGPLLQSGYMSLSALNTLVPLMGRSGTPPVPPDVLMAVVVALLTLALCSWIMPLLAVSPPSRKVVVWSVCACLWWWGVAVWAGRGAAYSAHRPQRAVVLDVWQQAPGGLFPEHYYWLPELDPNTRHVAEMLGERVDANTAEECARWVYCGAPYYLPVLGLVPRAHRVPTAGQGQGQGDRLPDHVRVHLASERRSLGNGTHLLHLNVTGPSHVVIIVSPREGVELEWWHAAVGGAGGGAGRGAGGGAAVRGAPFGARDTYFFALHRAREHTPHAPLLLRLRDTSGAPESGWPLAAVSVAGHGMAGPRAHRLRAALAALGPAVAATGWPVHLRLLHL